MAAAAVAQQTPAQKPDALSTQTPTAISDAWSGVLENAVAPEHPDVALSEPQTNPHVNPALDFVNHLYIDMRTELWRTQTSFSGQPTATGVINGTPSSTFNPAGIPSVEAFQPTANELYTLLSFGTRGWGSDRVNTDFSLRYRTDLTNVYLGAPGQDILNTYPRSRKFEIQTGYLEVNGKPGDGWFTGSTLRFGRQYVYGAELASFDGASFSRTRAKYTFSIYAGRRFTYYSDPYQRAVGGVDFVYRFGNASVEYSGLFYVKGSHVFNYRQRLPKDWLFNTYFKMVGSHPVDLALNGLWFPANGKTTLRLGFFQKLTNRDYFYDYTYIARDQDPYNSLLRLYLGPRSPYSQFTVDVHRTIIPRVRLGGTLWVRRLNENSADQGPFDTSFQDYRVEAQVFPWQKIETFAEFHQRDLDRKSPLNPASFDDVSATGETKVQDFSLQVGKSFAEGKFSVRGGGFLRRLLYQDQFFFIDDAQTKGWLGNASVKLDPHTRVYFDYSLDTDFYVWRPSIRNAQIFRLGLDWKY
jgi:hypothetical protein